MVVDRRAEAERPPPLGTICRMCFGHGRRKKSGALGTGDEPAFSIVVPWCIPVLSSCELSLFLKCPRRHFRYSYQFCSRYFYSLFLFIFCLYFMYIYILYYLLHVSYIYIFYISSGLPFWLTARPQSQMVRVSGLGAWSCWFD